MHMTPRMVRMMLVAVTMVGAASVVAPALAADEPAVEFRLFGGWGLQGHHLSARGESFNHGSPLGGLGVGLLMNDNLTLFADGAYADYDTGYLSTEVRATEARVGVEWLLPRLGEKSRFYLAPALGWGWYSWSAPGDGGPHPDDFDRSFASIGFGQRFNVGRANVLRWELRAAGSVGQNGLGGRHFSTYEALIGFAFGLPQKDSDRDGVVDRKDRCPGTPRGAKVDEHGCPIDSDGDGVPDGLDRCPDTPKGVTVDERGCPLDSDGDGVADFLDRCPGTPAGVKVDDRGCPLDSDGDGVPDGLDRCPDTPKGVKVDERGCPISTDTDRDGDGVPDGRDRCPDTPRGVRVDEVGCPTAPPVARQSVLQGVNFASDKADLTPESLAILDSVAQSLLAEPALRVEIAGHTDSTNTDAHNQKLSEARAEAVRAFLAGKGIAADRMEARGYGESQPIALNLTVDGRAKNRRVELKRLD